MKELACSEKVRRRGASVRSASLGLIGFNTTADGLGTTNPHDRSETTSEQAGRDIIASLCLTATIAWVARDTHPLSLSGEMAHKNGAGS